MLHLQRNDNNNNNDDYVVFAPVWFLQLPGGSGDAAFSRSEGRSLSILENVKQSRLPLSGGADHQQLQLFGRLGLSEVSPEVSKD